MLVAKEDPSVGPSFTLQNRVMRQVWNWTWLLLFRPSPRSLHAWRSFLLRAFGARIGAHVHVYPAVKIWAPWQLTIEDYAGVADGVTLYNMAHIHLGTRCVVSQGSHLCAGSHDYNSSNFQLIASPITVGPYAWICAEAFISPGVSLPEGAVVAPRAVVTKSLPKSWTVYGGVPARPIGARTRNVRQD